MRVLIDGATMSDPTAETPEAVMLADVEAAIVRLMAARMAEPEHSRQWVVFSGPLGAPLSVPLKFEVAEDATAAAGSPERCDISDATRFDSLMAGYIANVVKGAACSVPDAYELILRDYVTVQNYLKAAIAKKAGG